MVYVGDIAKVLEDFAPLEMQEDYDNSGLIIGDRECVVSSALITLDVNEEVLEEAISNDCNLVISHHPLIFKGLNRINNTDPVHKMVSTAIRNNIAVYAMHTNLDNSLNGLNAMLCNILSISDFRILLPVKGQLSKLVTFSPADHETRVRQALFDAGAGHIGNYDCCSFNSTGRGTFRALENTTPYVGKKFELHFENETRIEVVYPRFLEKRIISALINTHPYEEVAYDIIPLSNLSSFAGSGVIGLTGPVSPAEFLDRVRGKLGIPVLRHSLIRDKPISRVAVCTGSGSFLIKEALEANADAFLTADLKYHDFFEAGTQMLLADIGHYESEQIAKELIYGILIENFPNFAFLISKIDTNPVHYY